MFAKYFSNEAKLKAGKTQLLKDVKKGDAIPQFQSAMKDINEFKDLFGRINLTVNKFMCYEYIKSRKGNSIDDEDYHHEALKVLLGNNDKEVEIVAKKRRNLGLFEKIFHFFS